MEEYAPYPCQKCGMCCRRVDLIPEMRAYNRGDGVCIHLKVDNTCAIYEHRPNLCNGKYVYEKYYSNMTVKEYHKMISMYCQQNQDGIIKCLLIFSYISLNFQFFSQKTLYLFFCVPWGHHFV